MAFFTDLGNGLYRAQMQTTGPWDPRFQHGGPPSALLGRAVEQVAAREDVMVARVTVEILGPIPVADLQLSVRVARPGRSVELVEASMSAGGKEVARASAWRVRRTSEVAVASRRPPPPPIPEARTQPPLTGRAEGYLQAIDWRWAAGHFTEPGPATVWSRMLHPLLEGEEPSPLQRVLVVADSGNGVSSQLDPSEWYFINPELSVHLHREPIGEWICLDAATTVSSHGVGLATSVLSDQDGDVGVGAQTLFIGPR